MQIKDERKERQITFKNLELGDVYINSEGKLFIKTCNLNNYNCLDCKYFNFHQESLNEKVTLVNSQLTIW